MNTNQIRKYRAEWAKARDALRSLGRAKTTADADDERMRIHAQVTGISCSSKDLSNDNFDQVLAIFYSYSRAADLGSQMEQLSQPGRRCRYVADDLIDRINAMLIAAERHKQVIQDHGRTGYLLYLARRFGEPDLCDLDDAQVATWSKIIAALMVHYDRVSGKPPGQGRNATRRRPWGKPSRRFDRTPAPTPVTSDDPF